MSSPNYKQISAMTQTCGLYAAVDAAAEVERTIAPAVPMDDMTIASQLLSILPPKQHMVAAILNSGDHESIAVITNGYHRITKALIDLDFTRRPRFYDLATNWSMSIMELFSR
jgi:hypothetical protein